MCVFVWVVLQVEKCIYFFVHLRIGMLDVSIELNYGLIMDCLWIAHGWLMDRLADCLWIANGLLSALNSPKPWGHALNSGYQLQNSQYRSHFGSRYKSGPCFTAGLLASSQILHS